MSSNFWFRQTHRWFSVWFFLGFIFVGAAAVSHHYANWMALIVVPPIFLLLITGAYLFILPYLVKWRAR